MTEKQRNLFEDLGKPTMRGVRKCPKCGTYNGTRGVSCKNKACNLIFKEIIKKTEVNTEAVKVLTNSTLHIYSVKIQDSVADRRCFVHLPLIEGIDTLQDSPEVTYITQSAAHCYADCCAKPVENFCSLTLNLNPCSHIISTVNCVSDSQPLPLRNSVLRALPVSDEVKQEIWSLATKTEDHLVQRVTKNALVVKCKPDEHYPLGFLHFYVFEPVKGSKRFRIMCDCQSELMKPVVPKEKQMCLHFYACVCAFASNSKLVHEYRSLILSVFSIKAAGSQDSSQTQNNEDLSDSFDDAYPPSKRRKAGSTDISFLLGLHNNNIDGKMQTSSKKGTQANKKQLSTVDESSASISFENWLASVTERINQTMHFQFSGDPEPLIFHVPQPFFDCLQQRISTGSKKKRLPNATVAFTRKDAIPIGLFSKYTWHITNILHVKQIFDTPEMPLEITRSFVENRDGTYHAFKPLKDEMEDLAENFKKTTSNPLIKPLELKTFLKVGNMAIDQKQPTPFIVEWIPDILPSTHIGELRIKFEYGHQRNGYPEVRGNKQNSILQMQSL